ncbi:hypothetical protein NA57DRAFT_72883 [Rhizodiscina lignyota]|uniref:Uncharacterized protein n=1 Tax=Rhizodiscina lignyota TaxID=1504668 RepID=A0A9P4M8U9_9PEZI|nr:hypothetical protein NA57DRAFT_72883 [Rhizodiscina lignyota]
MNSEPSTPDMKPTNSFTPVNPDIKKEETPETSVPPSPPKTPVNPLKGRKRKNTSDGASDEKPAAAKKAKARKVAGNPEDLSSADRILYKMKMDGKSWAEIIAAIETATGEKKPRQTLLSRYATVTAVMSAVKEDDYETLKEAVHEVDAAIEQQVKDLRAKRFYKVAELMQEKGTELYPAGAVEKCYKKISTTSATPAIPSPAADTEE